MLAVCLAATIASFVTEQLQREPLDQSWYIRIGGLPSKVNADGTFTILGRSTTRPEKQLTARSLSESVPQFVRLVGFQPDGERTPFRCLRLRNRLMTLIFFQ